MTQDTPARADQCEKPVEYYVVAKGADQNFQIF